MAAEHKLTRGNPTPQGERTKNVKQLMPDEQSGGQTSSIAE